MVNTARVMGLNLDPDDFPGTYPLFEAETRRRVWWDVFYYDLYVPDAVVVGLKKVDSTSTGLYPIVWVTNR